MIKFCLITNKSVWVEMCVSSLISYVKIKRLFFFRLENPKNKNKNVTKFKNDMLVRTNFELQNRTRYINKIFQPNNDESLKKNWKLVFFYDIITV